MRSGKAYRQMTTAERIAYSARAAAYGRAVSAKRLAAGLCCYCGQRPHQPNRIGCDDCYRTRTLESRNRRQQTA